MAILSRKTGGISACLAAMWTNLKPEMFFPFVLPVLPVQMTVRTDQPIRMPIIGISLIDPGDLDRFL